MDTPLPPHGCLLPAPRSLLPPVRELSLPAARTTTFNRRCRMEARITAQSQSFKLRERLEEAKVSHGQEVRADLPNVRVGVRSEEHTSELQSRLHLVCRLLLEKKNKRCRAPSQRPWNAGGALQAILQ